MTALGAPDEPFGDQARAIACDFPCYARATSVTLDLLYPLEGHGYTQRIYQRILCSCHSLTSNPYHTPST
jgi:hypothetical protein